MDTSGPNSNVPSAAEARRKKQLDQLLATFAARSLYNATGYRLERRLKKPRYNSKASKAKGEPVYDEWALVISYKNNQDARNLCQRDYRWLQGRHPNEQYRIVRIEYQ